MTAIQNHRKSRAHVLPFPVLPSQLVNGITARPALRTRHVQPTRPRAAPLPKISPGGEPTAASQPTGHFPPRRRGRKEVAGVHTRAANCGTSLACWRRWPQVTYASSTAPGQHCDTKYSTSGFVKRPLKEALAGVGVIDYVYGLEAAHEDTAVEHDVKHPGAELGRVAARARVRALVRAIGQGGGGSSLRR